MQLNKVWPKWPSIHFDLNDPVTVLLMDTVRDLRQQAHDVFVRRSATANWLLRFLGSLAIAMYLATLIWPDSLHVPLGWIFLLSTFPLATLSHDVCYSIKSQYEDPPRKIRHIRKSKFHSASKNPPYWIALHLALLMLFIADMPSMVTDPAAAIIWVAILDMLILLAFGWLYGLVLVSPYREISRLLSFVGADIEGEGTNETIKTALYGLLRKYASSSPELLAFTRVIAMRKRPVLICEYEAIKAAAYEQGFVLPVPAVK